MKILTLILCIFSLAIITSPTLAFSASELISSHYAGQNAFLDNDNSISLTSVPSQVIITPFPTQDISSIFDTSLNEKIFAISTIIPRIPTSHKTITQKTYTCPPEKPVGELSPCKSTCMCFEGYACDCYDPQTGEPFRFGTDLLGRVFVVNDGCPVKWANG